MEISELVKRLENEVPGSILETRPFGGSKEPSLWIEMRAISNIAQVLSGEAFGFDWLENLAVVEIEGALVLTYFLRSFSHPGTLVLRGSIVPEAKDRVVSVDSVSAVWPSAVSAENELASLFGIEFLGLPSGHLGVLPAGWQGFPLRKGYVFPKEVEEIAHYRPVGRGDL